MLVQNQIGKFKKDGSILSRPDRSIDGDVLDWSRPQTMARLGDEAFVVFPIGYGDPLRMQELRAWYAENKAAVEAAPTPEEDDEEDDFDDDEGENFENEEDHAL